MTKALGLAVCGMLLIVACGSGAPPSSAPGVSIAPPPPAPVSASWVAASASAAPAESASAAPPPPPPAPFRPGQLFPGPVEPINPGKSRQLLKAKLEWRFRGVYSQPVVQVRETRLGGVVVAIAHDKRREIADPVPTTCWLVTGRKKRRHDEKAIAEVWKKHGPGLQNEQHALVAASLYYECGRCRPIWDPKPGEPLLHKIPAAVIQRLEPPRVHRAASDWHVWIHAHCYSRKTFGLSGPTCRTIRKHHFVIHENGYRVRSEDLWDCKVAPRLSSLRPRSVAYNCAYPAAGLASVALSSSALSEAPKTLGEHR